MSNKEQIYIELLQCGNEMSNILFLFKQLDKIEFLDKDKKLFERLHRTWDRLNDELNRVKLEEIKSNAVCSEDKSE